MSGTASKAGIDVTFYPGWVNHTGGMVLDLGTYEVGGYYVAWRYPVVIAGDMTTTVGFPWTQGTDLPDNAILGVGPWAYYSGTGGFAYGASVGVNYANISFNGDDDIYEAVAKFNFDGAGGGVLVAIAKDNTLGGLTISAGVTAIDGAAVPEPSAMLLGLLAVGSSACARRRARPVRG